MAYECSMIDNIVYEGSEEPITSFDNQGWKSCPGFKWPLKADLLDEE